MLLCVGGYVKEVFTQLESTIINNYKVHSCMRQLEIVVLNAVWTRHSIITIDK